MTFEYTYEKVVDPQILQTMILFNDSLRPKFSSISLEESSVTVSFSEALTVSEHDELNVIVSDYSETHELVVRDSIERNVMSAAMLFGQTFLTKFAANNIYRGKTSEQINSLLSTYPTLILAAQTGSLNTLYAVISSMVPADNISQEEIDEFKKRLELYLGLI